MQLPDEEARILVVQQIDGVMARLHKINFEIQEPNRTSAYLDFKLIEQTIAELDSINVGDHRIILLKRRWDSFLEREFH